MGKLNRQLASQSETSNEPLYSNTVICTYTGRWWVVCDI